MKRAIQFLLIGVLVMGAFGFAAPKAPAPANAHPMLVEAAAATPTQMVRVIVQKTDAAANVEAVVEELGGRVVRDLSMISAFAAEMTAKAAMELAAVDSVGWISLDAPVVSSSDNGKGKPPPREDPPAELPENTYLDTLGVRDVWAMGLQGEGIGVAVIDSGIFKDRDFSTVVGKPFSRVVKSINFNDEMKSTSDLYGHGTHVAGIIGGNGGASPDTMYSGIAPKVNLISLKVNDDETGMCYESDVVAAMQWIYENKAEYNIRVLNLSLNSSVESSYHTSPLDAAVEVLWFNGVVVVTSAGNYWDDLDYNPVLAAPANDPFVITVGATDEKGSARRQDDSVANFSSFGTTSDGIYKPDIYAPGKDIRSVYASGSTWEYDYPDRLLLDDEYFRLSGTSMAAPMVTGAVVLLLQDEPDLTPDQVKYRLINTAPWIGPGKYLDVYEAVTGTTTESANTGLMPSLMLATGEDAIDFASVGWNSVGWNSVGWNSVGWNSVGWNSVGWNSTFWGE